MLQPASQAADLATRHPRGTAVPESRRANVSLYAGAIELTYGRSCQSGRETGYRGRVGVFELLMVDDPVRSKIQHRSIASEIRDGALTRGMRLLRDDGVAKIRQGLTTVEEVSRVTVRAAM